MWMNVFKAICASLPLFRAFGVPVRAHSTWLLYVAGFMVLVGWERGSFIRGAIRIGFFFALLFGSLLVHEYAHVFVARRYGCRASRILLLPIGCVTQIENLGRAPHELWIALAGPVASGVLGIACGLILLPLDHGYGFWTAHTILSILCYVNFLVAGFNMIPCYPMDGGRILRSLMALLIKRISARDAAGASILATRIAVRYIGWPIAVGMVAASCLYLHDWMYVVIFSLLILAGEAELWLLRNPENLTADSH